MTAKVILNPYAGRWAALKRRDEVTKALDEAGIAYELAISEYPGHGTELARQAVEQGFSPILSAGGDGSISEVVNGMMLACNSPERVCEVPLGVMPLGSANDFVVNLGLPKDLPSAAQVIAAGRTRKIDLGIVRFGTDRTERFFDNNSAIGLEPTITLIQQRIKRLRGVIRYLVATLRGVMQNPQWNVRIEWEDGVYEGMANLVTVGNNPLTGGLFYMTPHANPYDGLLTFVYGSIPTRMQILRILPMTMKPGPGSYVEQPGVHEHHTRWLKIHTQSPTPLHTDGEIQSEAIQDMEYQVLPASLPVLM